MSTEATALKNPLVGKTLVVRGILTEKDVREFAEQQGIDPEEVTEQMIRDDFNKAMEPENKVTLEIV